MNKKTILFILVAVSLIGIAAEVSANMWTPEQNANQLDLLYSNGTVVKYNGLGHLNYPHGVVYDGNGNLWIPNHQNSNLTKFIISNTTFQDYILPTPDCLTIAYGGGFVWVGCANNHLYQVFPNNGTVTDRGMFNTSNAYNFYGIAWSSNESAVFIQYFGNGATGYGLEISKIYTNGTSIMDWAHEGNGEFGNEGVTIGKDGMVWATLRNGAVIKASPITPNSTTKYSGTVPFSDFLAYDANVSMWTPGNAGNPVTQSTLSKVNANTGLVVNYTGLGFDPLGIAYDNSSSIWVATRSSSLVTQVWVSNGSMINWTGISNPHGIASDVYTLPVIQYGNFSSGGGDSNSFIPAAYHYYDFTNTTTSLIDIANTTRNGVKVGTPANTTGLIGNGNSFSNAAYNITNLGGDGQGTFNFWFNETDVVTNNFLLGQYGNAGNFWLRTIGGGLNGEVYGPGGITVNSSVVNLTTNAWHMGTVIWGTGGFELWQDGVKVFTDANTQDLSWPYFFIGGRADNLGSLGGNASNVVFDEVGVWGVRLNQSQIIYLYNGSKGVVYNPLPPSSPGMSITLNNPTDGQNINSNPTIFSATGVDPTSSTGLNISIYANWTGGWAINQTNSSALNNTQTNFSIVNVPDGKYIWAAAITNSTTTVFSTSNYTFTKDTIPPNIVINQPYGQNFPYLVYGNNLTLNVTATDTTSTLSSCWYNYNNSNTTFSCINGNASTTNFSLDDQTNINAYANDTFGNINSSTTSWTYSVFDFNNYTYSRNVSESSLITISGQFQLGAALSNAFLQYNNTNYSVSINSLGGNQYIFTSNPMAPGVNTNTNVSWYFWINGISTTSFNQTIINTGIDNCSSFTNNILNFTVMDEENLSSMSDTKIDYAFNIYNLQRNVIVMSVNATTTSNPLSICLQDPLTSNYSMDATLKYNGNSSYAIRYYNFLNYTLSSSSTPKNITLYDVLSTSALPFLLTFRDSSLILNPNILVYVNKQYLATNDFKTVEIPKTDTNGQTILNLVRNTAKYNLIMIDIAGNIVGSFSDIVAFCQDYTIGNCAIDLNAAGTSQTTYNASSEAGISYSISYSNSSSTISTAFNSLNSSSQNVRLEVITENQFENKTICDSSLALSSGTLTCNIASALPTNQNFFANIYANGKLIVTRIINANPALGDTGGAFGTDGYFFAFLLILFIILLFSDDRQVLVILLGVGWLAVIALGLIRGAILGFGSGGIWLVITIVIMIWKLKKEETGT